MHELGRQYRQLNGRSKPQQLLRIIIFLGKFKRHDFKSQQTYQFKYIIIIVVSQAAFGSCKSISGKQIFFRNAIFRKRKYFHVFGCILKNVSKNIFWCLVVLLKTPQKTHFLLVGHIFSVAKRIYNTIHSSIQKHKQNPKKKNHQIRSNPVTFSHIFLVAKRIYNIIHSSIQKHKQNPEKKIIKSGQIERRRKRERQLGSTRGCDRRGASRDRDRREGKIAVGAVLRAITIGTVLRDCGSAFGSVIGLP